ncbi:MAG: hypothetical protein AAGD33_14815 [Actinomycetota bacterium]
MTVLHRVDRSLPDGVTDRPVEGHHVPEASTFGSVVDRTDPVLVVFLRHYG